MDAKSLKQKRTAAFLELVQRDISAARKLLPDMPGHAAFQVQQAAEKLLRAVLEHEQTIASPTHSLRQLAQLLPKDHRWRDAFDELDRISSAATRYRYPTSAGNLIDADEGLTSTDLALVDKLSREVSAWLSFRM
jgi:HEPN domain-containing protein